MHTHSPSPDPPHPPAHPLTLALPIHTLIHICPPCSSFPSPYASTVAELAHRLRPTHSPYPPTCSTNLQPSLPYHPHRTPTGARAPLHSQDATLVLRLFDYDESGSSDFMGTVTTQINALPYREVELPVILKNNKSSKKPAPFLKVGERRPSFPSPRVSFPFLPYPCLNPRRAPHCFLASLHPPLLLPPPPPISASSPSPYTTTTTTLTSSTPLSHPTYCAPHFPHAYR